MAKPEWLVAWLLRLTALMELLAVGAVFMPTAWMELVHARLGMGPLPDAPVVQYLTRSLSGMYAFHGAVVMYLSFCVRQQRPLIRLWGWLSVGFGVGMFVLDLWAGMPLPWVLGEGPPLVALWASVLLLLRNDSASQAAPAAHPHAAQQVD